eukprot:CAMPEP_0206829534 /NCGR_PEP_ID=MMETSP0975-20121206/16414_1 /ASSEMBLY_ACC=CAM_ASM_000399 /TAXON_ID=483370 /ORGANISM="non described non described, Strain CCMP2097" /LENGTH=80 /DNA_ID=CAMNT_0054371873 /DNA_START=100 /DNA_END=340 /DNA_ORIENTATION=+
MARLAKHASAFDAPERVSERYYGRASWRVQALDVEAEILSSPRQSSSEPSTRRTAMSTAPSSVARTATASWTPGIWNDTV